MGQCSNQNCRSIQTTTKANYSLRKPSINLRRKEVDVKKKKENKKQKNPKKSFLRRPPFIFFLMTTTMESLQREKDLSHNSTHLL